MINVRECLEVKLAEGLFQRSELEKKIASQAEALLEVDKLREELDITQKAADQRIQREIKQVETRLTAER
jgi:hypothetical protein